LTASIDQTLPHSPLKSAVPQVFRGVVRTEAPCEARSCQVNRECVDLLVCLGAAAFTLSNPPQDRQQIKNWRSAHTIFAFGRRR
jgi:hypothetical protein